MSIPTKSFPISPSASYFTWTLSPPIRTLFPSALLPSQKLSFFPNTAQKQDKLPLHFQESAVLLIKCRVLAIDDSSTNSFVDSGTMLFSLFQLIGFNQSDTLALLDSNPMIKLTPFESIRTRIHSLQSLGVTGLGLSRLIVKRPDLLTAEEVGAVLSFLLDSELIGKIKSSQIEHLFKVTEPKFLAGFEAKVRLLVRLGIPPEKIDYVLNKAHLNKALCLKSFEDIERMFTFLNRFGGVNLILRHPELLNYDLDMQLIPRIGFILKLSGGDEAGTATVLRKLPGIVAYTADHLKDHVEFFKSFAGLSEEQIFRIITVYPNTFSASRENKLHPRIGFLKECGFSSHDIFRFLIRCPLFVSLSFEGNLSHKLVYLVKIGYKNKTKELAMAIGAVTRSSCKNMQEVIGLYLNYGLTCDDIMQMSMKHPQVLQYNHRSLEEKLDYLVEEMGREVVEVVSFPPFLGYKLDGRIKQRYEVKKQTLGEGTSLDGMSLNRLLSESAASFSKKSKRKQPVPAINVLDETDD